MDILTLKNNLYWIGAQDPELRVFDIIMETRFGTSYNSYLLKGSEKTALIETVKLNFYTIYQQAIEQVIDISAIDYIIVNHTEPDHVGSVEKLLELNPEIQLVGTTAAINFLKNIVNHDFTCRTVKEGDSLSLGNMTLQFMPLPYLHWPDTMYTYWVEEKVLFTCDSFGSHYSHPGVLRSTVTETEDYLSAAKYYFDCIIAPFRHPYMENALKRIKALDISMICPGHGPVLDSSVSDILHLYEDWCSNQASTGKTVVMPYVSAYGYTQSLAEAIQKGIEENAGITVHTYDMETADPAAVAHELEAADGILFGTPTIVGDALAPIWNLTLTMHTTVSKGKLGSAFGSYGWSGEGVPNILERLKQLKLSVVDGYRVKFKPSTDDLAKARDYGRNFGKQLLSH